MRNDNTTPAAGKDGLLQRVKRQVQQNPGFKTLTQNEAKLLLAYFPCFDARDYGAWPGLTKLARVTGITKSAAARARTALIKKRFLKVISGGGRAAREVDISALVGVGHRRTGLIKTTVVQLRRYAHALTQGTRRR